MGRKKIAWYWCDGCEGNLPADHSAETYKSAWRVCKLEGWIEVGKKHYCGECKVDLGLVEDDG